MATNVHLTPELEQFARDCVEAGRYNNVSEVVRSALRLLQDAEERRGHFQRMIGDAEHEADRDGTAAIDSLIPGLEEIIVTVEQ